MAFVYRKLGATLEASQRPWRADHRPKPGTYASAAEFLADLRLVQESLRRHGGQRLADGRLGTLIRQAEIFGFHLATLDLRQHAMRHTSALAEVFARYGLAAGYADLPEEAPGRDPDPRDPGRPPARPAPSRLQRRPRTRPSSSSG